MLVDIGSLRTYEYPDNRKVAEIVISLRRSETLVNPVVVDPRLNLLIDGHHRVKAFDWLGLTRIPAFTVDYLSDAVAVRGWSRATTARASDVRWAFQLVGSAPTGPWGVVAAGSDGVALARRSFTSAAPSARYLAHLASCIEAMGHQVFFTPLTIPRRDGWIHSYIDPVVGKNEVLAAVDEDRRFPYEVNRHLIDGRPVSMRIPFNTLSSQAAFAQFVNNAFANGRPTFASGIEQEGRLYEECVTLFAQRDGDRR
jgi:ParB-like nuclease domain